MAAIKEQTPQFLGYQYTDKMIEFIREKRDEGLTWLEVADAFNDYFKVSPSKKSDSIRKAFYVYQDLNSHDQDAFIKNLQKTRSSQKRSSILARDNRMLVDHLNQKEEILEAIKAIVKETNIKPVKITQQQKQIKGKRKMVIEANVSDVHYGKLTESFNSEIARNRISQFASVLIGEFKRYSKQYDIEKIVIALLGDIIESETMHGFESARGSEFGNSEQIRIATVSLFYDLILPIARLGIPMHLPCVTGNHDRVEKNKTFNSPGKHNVTWIIYNMIEELSKAHGLKHLTFDIPEKPYAIYKIFNDLVLYEHYDHVKGAGSYKAFRSHLSQRSTQFGQIISFMRGGHFHEAACFRRGTVIVNGSVCGQDSYADVLGFDSEPSQTINYYVENNHRPNSFYHSFPVYLD